MKKSTIKKITVALLWFVILLLLLSAILLINMLVKDETKGDTRWSLSVIGVGFILLFTYFFLIVVVKFKDEIMLKNEKWSNEFRQFNHKMNIKGMAFFIFLVIWGLNEIFFYKNYEGILQIFIGSVFLIFNNRLCRKGS